MKSHMFTWGIIWALIATFFVGISITLQKKESMHYTDRYIALIYQYAFVVFWSLIFIGIYIYQTKWSFLPTMSSTNRLLFVSMCIVGYIWANLIFTAYKHLQGGVVYVMGGIGVFLMYFINIRLFPGIETLSPLKIALAVLFFLVLVQFIIKRQEWDLKDHHFINKYTIYVILAAICGAYYVTWNNFLLKTWAISPFHTLAFAELITLLIALGWYFVWHKWTVQWLKKNITKRDAIIFMTIGLCGATSGALQYYAYQTNPANLINFIKMFSVITTSTLCRIFLNDKLTKKQICLIGCAVIVLIAFLLVK